MAKKRCKHTWTVTFYDEVTGEEFSRRCSGCGAQLSLGWAAPVVDDQSALVDFNAAALIQEIAVTGEARLTHAEIAGFAGQAESPFAGNRGWYAGWLARVWADHDELLADDDLRISQEVTRELTPVQAEAEAHFNALCEAPHDPTGSPVEDIANEMNRIATADWWAGGEKPWDAAEPAAIEAQERAAGYQIVSCIRGESNDPRSVGGVSRWDTEIEASNALDLICEEPDHPDPDDFTVVPVAPNPVGPGAAFEPSDTASVEPWADETTTRQAVEVELVAGAEPDPGVELEATAVTDDEIRALGATLVEGTATDAIGRHVVDIALGGRGQLDRDPTPKEIAECRARCIDTIARREGSAP